MCSSPRKLICWSLPLILGVAVLYPRPSAAIIDLDTNGVSDIWELAYGALTDGAADDDEDGATNQEEYLAGTDPKNSSSKLGITSVTGPNKGILSVKWPTVAGKRYRLQVSFETGIWEQIGEPVMGDGKEFERKMVTASTFLNGSAKQKVWSFTGMTNHMATLKSLANGGLTVPLKDARLFDLKVLQTAPPIDQFGECVSGWLLPPATGSYTFWVGGDDQAEWGLSSDADPLKKQILAASGASTSFGQWEKYASQKSAPVKLTAGKPYYFELFHRESTGSDHVEVAWTGPGLNPDKEIIDGKYLAVDSKTLAQFYAARKTPTFQIKVEDVDSDGDGLTDAEEAVVGLDPLNPKTVSRIADLQTLTASLSAPNVITIGAAVARGYETESKPAVFTFFRSGNVNPITIQYTVGGLATAGSDYETLSGTVFLPTGQTSVSVEVEAKADIELEAAETVEVTVAPNGSVYQVGNPATASVTLDDAPDLVFVAALRSINPGVSGGFGSAALRMVGNKEFSTVSLSYGNLASNAVSSDFYIGTSTAGGKSALILPQGQVSALNWTFAPLGDVTKENILQALERGTLWARVKSSQFPNGEIFGQFVREKAFVKETKPRAVPVAPSKPGSTAEAVRFLLQATYGPTEAEITKVKTMGYRSWILDQFRQPLTEHLPLVHTRRLELLAADPLMENDGYQRPRQEAWWQVALTAPDQLRQRMAFALSEIVVVSDVGVLAESHEGITHYYDLLLKHAFGNYRDLLEEVTLSPIMGQYLSMIRNRKPDPVNGSEPDENYAREVMQLFSIGLSQLHPDGTLKLGIDGMPIATYTQNDIVGLAHVFTGWSYHYDGAVPSNNVFIYGTNRQEIDRMKMYPNFHDTESKRLINGVVIPAGLTGEQDLKLALDTLFNHPNVGPFIARRLIQRFVTSNPSPGYIRRVTAAFEKNSAGVRGDLKATLLAVLLDYEARSIVPVQGNLSQGKLREPLLRFTHLMRTFKATPPKTTDPRFFLDVSGSSQLGHQAPMKSGSVFNFFQPGYISPGPIAVAGLFSPEFQITSETTVVLQTNLQADLTNNGIGTPEKDATSGNQNVKLNLETEIALLNRVEVAILDNEKALIDRCNDLLLSGQMSPSLRSALAEYLQNSRSSSASSRVKNVLYVITASPEYAVQK